MVWDDCKGGSSGEQKGQEEDEIGKKFSFFFRIIGRTGSICGRKP